MTPKERAAMQQALEALEEATSYTSCESWSPSMTDDCNKAITALREALDHSGETAEMVQEPVAWTESQIHRAYRNSPELHKDVSSFAAFKRVVKAVEAMHGYTAPQPTIRENLTVQEPVAIVTGYYGGRLTVTPFNLASTLPTGTALYTTPQPDMNLNCKSVQARLATSWGYVKAEQAEQEPAPWKHDCAALCMNDVELWIDNCPHCGKPRTAPSEPVKQEPFMCEPVPPISEDGWTDWVCPKPQGYLMQCCDCGLIHEVDSRVAMYQPMPSEEFEVVENPNMQCQWRVRRRDDLRESNVKV